MGMSIDQAAHIHRSLLFVIKEIDAVKEKCDDEGWKFAESADRLKALQLLIHQYGLSFWCTKRSEIRMLDVETLLQRLKSWYAKYKVTSSNGSIDTLFWNGSEVIQDKWLAKLEDGTKRSNVEGYPEFNEDTEIYTISQVLEHLDKIGVVEKEVKATDSIAAWRRTSLLANKPTVVGKLPRFGRHSLSAIGGQTRLATDHESDIFALDSPPPQLIGAHGKSSTRQASRGIEAYSPSSDRSRSWVGSFTRERSSHEDSPGIGSIVEEEVLQVIPRLGTKDIQKGLEKIWYGVGDLCDKILRQFELVALPTLPGPFVKSSQELESLYETLLSSEWKINVEVLSNAHVLVISNTLRSLMSAVLYNTIFKEGSVWQRALCEDIDIWTEPDAENLFWQLQSQDSSDILKQADKFIDRAVSNAFGPNGARRGMKDVFDYPSLANFMANTLSPQIRQYGKIAAAHRGLDDGDTYDGLDWPSTLAEGLEQLLQSAGAIKLRLTQSCTYHSFSWPAFAEDLDSNSMTAQSPGYGDQQLVHTLFPGIMVNFGHWPEARQITLAEVLTRTKPQVEDRNLTRSVTPMEGY